MKAKVCNTHFMSYQEVRVKVTPNTKKEGVEELKDGRLAVSVKADRKGGEANDRAKIILASHFGAPLQNISIVSGHTNPTKTVRIKK